MCSKKKDFVRFLKEKGVYAAYRRNFSLEYLRIWHHKLYIKIAVDGEKFFDVVDWGFYINHAFHWASTKEGHDFWHNLSKSWQILSKE